MCTLRRGRRLPRRNTRYRAGATPYPDRTFTGWNAPAFLAHQGTPLRGRDRTLGGALVLPLRGELSRPRADDGRTRHLGRPLDDLPMGPEVRPGDREAPTCSGLQLSAAGPAIIGDLGSRSVRLSGVPGSRSV